MEESKIKKESKNVREIVSFEARQNLLGFFDLLLRIDMRNHPEKYKNNNDSEQSEENKC